MSRAERIERVREGSATERFLSAPEFAEVRAGIERLYHERGYEPAPGLSIVGDFMQQAYKLVAAEDIPPHEKLELVQGLTGLPLRESSALLSSVGSMFYADAVAVRSTERDEQAREALPANAAIEAEKMLTHPQNLHGLRNVIEGAVERHSPKFEERQTRHIDSARHLAVRDAVDRHTGGRNLDARLDNVQISAFADRERREAVERAENYTPSLRDSIEAAFSEDDQ